MCAIKKKRRKKKKSKKDPDVWTEAEYEEYLCGLYGLEFIVDYTPAGLPIGLPIDGEPSFIDDDDCEPDKRDYLDVDISF
jgi:hypothetical protein